MFHMDRKISFKTRAEWCAMGDLEFFNNNGIYTGSCYVTYDSPDETGFEMEDDYYFFDEFFRQRKNFINIERFYCRNDSRI